MRSREERGGSTRPVPNLTSPKRNAAHRTDERLHAESAVREWILQVLLLLRLPLAFLPHRRPEHAYDVDGLGGLVVLVPEEDEHVAQRQEHKEQLFTTTETNLCVSLRAPIQDLMSHYYFCRKAK